MRQYLPAPQSRGGESQVFKLNTLTISTLLSMALMSASTAQAGKASKNVRGQRGANRLGRLSAPPTGDRLRRRALVKQMGRRQALKYIKASRREARA